MRLFHKDTRHDNTAVGSKQEKDWTHRTVIHHVKYAYPSNFTYCGDYPALDADAFQEAVQEAKSIVKSLNLNVQSAGVLERVIRLCAARVMVQNILEDRAQHHLQALQLRSNLEYQLQNHIAHLQLLQSLAKRIQQEIDERQY